MIRTSHRVPGFGTRRRGLRLAPGLGWGPQRQHAEGCGEDCERNQERAKAPKGHETVYVSFIPGRTSATRRS